MSAKKINEAQLIPLLKKGDGSAFALIYEYYAPVLWSFLEKFNLPHVDIEDSIQTTFIKLWENKEKIEEGKPLKNFLMTLAKNDIYNKVKRNIIAQKYLNNLIPEEETEMDNSKELQMILLRILESLPEKRATVFRMSRLEGLKNDEIAKELGISKSTVENHINNSSSLIKKILKNLGFNLLCLFSIFS